MRSPLVAIIVLAVVSIILYGWSAKRPRDLEISGETMGTTYTIKIAHASLSKGDVNLLRSDIRNLLDRLNNRFSTYDENSEISRFNSSQDTNYVAVSYDTAAVTRFALAIARVTEGAFDPTVMPLVALWGFGPGNTIHAVPSPNAISTCLEDVGFEKLSVRYPTLLAKASPAITLDLNAIAKGYAVDCLAALLATNKCNNVFVEIGGEISATGRPSHHDAWRVAIDVPQMNAAPGLNIMSVIELRDACVATSGDYRNYFTADDRVFSHVIDPRTGYPVSNRVASVTVTAEDCMTADALATALMVLGLDAGMRTIDKYEDTDALFILRRPCRSARARICTTMAYTPQAAIVATILGSVTHSWPPPIRLTSMMPMTIATVSSRNAIATWILMSLSSVSNAGSRSSQTLNRLRLR